MEILVVSFVAVVAILVAWRMRTKRRASDKVRLDEAWRLVLNDPNYPHRRRIEEFNREVEAKAREAEAEARRVEGL